MDVSFEQFIQLCNAGCYNDVLFLGSYLFEIGQGLSSQQRCVVGTLIAEAEEKQKRYQSALFWLERAISELHKISDRGSINSQPAHVGATRRLTKSTAEANIALVGLTNSADQIVTTMCNEVSLKVRIARCYAGLGDAERTRFAIEQIIERDRPAEVHLLLGRVLKRCATNEDRRAARAFESALRAMPFCFEAACNLLELGWSFDEVIAIINGALPKSTTLNDSANQKQSETASFSPKTSDLSGSASKSTKDSSQKIATASLKSASRSESNVGGSVSAVSSRTGRVESRPRGIDSRNEANASASPPTKQRTPAASTGSVSILKASTSDSWYISLLRAYSSVLRCRFEDACSVFHKLCGSGASSLNGAAQHPAVNWTLVRAYAGEAHYLAGDVQRAIELLRGANEVNAHCVAKMDLLAYLLRKHRQPSADVATRHCIAAFDSLLSVPGEPLRRLAVRLMNSDRNAAETWIAAAYANLSSSQSNGEEEHDSERRRSNVQSERALLFANRALEIDPRNAHAHFLKATILMRAARRNSALSAGNAQTSAANLDEALALLNEARRIAPHYFDFQQAVIELHIVRAEFVTAKRRCRDELMARFGTNARTLTTQALVLKAEAQYAKSHKEAGSDGENAAALLDRALVSAQRAVELAGNNIAVSTILVYAELLIAKRDLDRSISFLTERIEEVRSFGRVMRVSDAELASLYEQLGNAHLEAKQYAEALGSFTKCLKLDGSRKRAAQRKRQAEAEMEKQAKLRRTAFAQLGAPSLTTSPMAMRFATATFRGPGASTCQQHASTQTLVHGTSSSTAPTNAANSNSTPAPLPTTASAAPIAATFAATPQLGASHSPALLNTVTPAAQAPPTRPPPLDALASGGDSADMSSMFGATMNGALLTSGVSVFLTDDEPTNEAGSEEQQSAGASAMTHRSAGTSRPIHIEHGGTIASAHEHDTSSLNEQLGELDEQAEADGDADWYAVGGVDEDDDEDAPASESDADGYLGDQFEAEALDDGDDHVMAIDEGNLTETTAEASAVADMSTDVQDAPSDAAPANVD